MVWRRIPTPSNIYAAAARSLPPPLRELPREPSDADRLPGRGHEPVIGAGPGWVLASTRSPVAPVTSMTLVGRGTACSLGNAAA